MRFEVNIDKRYFFAFVLIGLIIVGIVGVVAYNANPTLTSGNASIFGHSVDEINWGQTIQGTVKASDFCVGTKCLGTLSVDGSGGSQWQNQTGSANIYFNSGNVGIGTSAPTGRVDIVSRYYKEVASGHTIGWSSPRCPCDTSSGQNAMSLKLIIV